MRRAAADYGALGGGSAGEQIAEQLQRVVQARPGAASFSELELQGLRAFIDERNPRIALNFHTFGNMLFYPSRTSARSVAPLVALRQLCVPRLDVKLAQWKVCSKGI